MKNIFKFLPLLFLLFVLSCKKDQPINKPPYEKTNNIKAKINGVAWEACDDSWGFSGPVVSSQYFPGNYFDMSGINSCQTISSYTYIKITGLNNIGTYGLGGTSINVGDFTGLYLRPDGIPRSFETDSIHKGTVTVTKFDLNKKLISGTFQFYAYNADTNIVINITEGVFNDVNILVQ